MSCEAAIAKLSYLLAEYPDINIVKAKLEIPLRGEMEDMNYNKRRKSLQNIEFIESVLYELSKFSEEEVCLCRGYTLLFHQIHQSCSFDFAFLYVVFVNRLKTIFLS